MKPFSIKNIFLAIIFVGIYFSAYANEHRNNFRLEKRHYRKGFYFDCWLHPKTYPRNYSTPETIDRPEPVEKAQPIPVDTPQQSIAPTSTDGNHIEFKSEDRNINIQRQENSPQINLNNNAPSIAPNPNINSAPVPNN